jgi:hypothetical protein
MEILILKPSRYYLPGTAENHLSQQNVHLGYTSIPS